MTNREIPDAALPRERLAIAQDILNAEFFNAISNVENLVKMRRRARELDVDIGPLVHRIPAGVDREKVWVRTGPGYRDGYWSIKRVHRRTIKVDWERMIVCLSADTDPLWDKIVKGDKLDV